MKRPDAGRTSRARRGHVSAPLIPAGVLKWWSWSRSRTFHPTTCTCVGGTASLDSRPNRGNRMRAVSGSHLAPTRLRDERSRPLLPRNSSSRSSFDGSEPFDELSGVSVTEEHSLSGGGTSEVLGVAVELERCNGSDGTVVRVAYWEDFSAWALSRHVSPFRVRVSTFSSSSTSPCWTMRYRTLISTHAG